MRICFEFCLIIVVLTYAFNCGGLGIYYPDWWLINYEIIIYECKQNKIVYQMKNNARLTVEKIYALLGVLRNMKNKKKIK